MSGERSAQKGLRTFGGGAPPGLAGDLRAIERLPPAVRESFWEVLEPNLPARVDARAVEATHAYCDARRVTMNDLAAPVGACRLLFRRAAETDASPDDLRADLKALLGEGASVEEPLVRWYSKARPILRRELVYLALADHGALATGVDWRLDMVRATQSADMLNTPIVIMTFRYQEGDENKRITLQLVPEVMEQLQAACAKIMR